MSAEAAVIYNPYKELKVDAGVRIEIFKGQTSRLFQVHGVGQRRSAFICVRGYVVTLWCPG